MILVAVYGVMMYGPRFLKQWIEVRHTMAKQNPTYLKEYIALLETDRHEAKKENEQLKREIALLRSVIKKEE